MINLVVDLIGLLTKSSVKSQATDRATRGTDREKGQSDELFRGLRRNSNVPKLPNNSTVVPPVANLSLVALYFTRLRRLIFVKSPI